MLGSLSAVLLAWIGALLIGARAAIAAGLMLAFHGTVVFFDGELLPPCLTTVLTLAAVAVALHARSRYRPTWSFLAGLLSGLAAVCTAQALLVLPVLAAFSRPRRAALLLLAGGAFALLPCIVRNASRGAANLISYNGPINLYIGNNPDYDATVAIRPGWAWTKLESEPRQNGAFGYGPEGRYFVRKVLHYAWADPVGFAGLQLKKLRLLLGGNEIFRDTAIYPFRAQSTVLRHLLWKVPGWAFPSGLILPLGVLGLCVCGRRNRLLLALCLVQAAGVVAFFVTARYRLAIIPWLILFSTAVPGWLATTPTLKAKVLAGAALAGLLGLSNANQGRMERTLNADAQWALAEQLQIDGRDEDALRLVGSAISADPASAEPWVTLGHIQIKEGRLDQAEAAFKRALDIDGDSFPALGALGALDLNTGRAGEAVGLLERARSLQVDDWVTVVNLATAYDRLARRDQAVALLRAYTARFPQHALPHYCLGRWLVMSNERTAGLAELRSSVIRGGDTVRGLVASNPDLDAVRDEVLGPGGSP